MQASRKLAQLGKLLFLTSFLVIISGIEAPEPSGDVFYQVPNPFEKDANGVFAIKSFQTSVSASNKRTQLEVEEYFSLSKGLSFSLHRDRNDLSKAYALISDGERGKAYLVRSPDFASNASSLAGATQVDCELDHLHHHRQVFPWQYVYDAPAAAKRKRKKNSAQKSASKRFIYGVGAIWLNAISRKLVSNQVAEDSPYPDSNLWQMSEPALSVKLLFERPKTATRAQREQMESLIAASKLNSVQLERKLTLNRHKEGARVSAKELENISVLSFESGLNFDEQRLAPFRFMLERCRETTEQHRLFPSLMRAMSLSPQRLYSLEYIHQVYAEPNYAPLAGLHSQPGAFDEQLKRHTWQPEYRREWFSLSYETQVSVYQALPQRSKSDLAPAAEQGDFMAEIFMKRFTERDNKVRSSRNAQVAYHLRENRAELASCTVGEAEPMPKDHLMLRPVHFLRHNVKGDQRKLTGYLTGLGALLLNAADVHYKQFQVFKKNIQAIVNPVYLTRRQVKVNEWQFEDRKTSRTFHFYFLDHEQVYFTHDMSDLVRVDVRNSRTEAADADEPPGAESDDDEADLIVRYELVSLELELDEDDLDYMFTPPDICTPPNNDDQSEDSQADKDDADFRPDDDWYKFFEGDKDENDDDDEAEREADEAQSEGEEFEFHPGVFMESLQLPDFFEFLDGATGYTIESTLELAGEPSEPELSKSLGLREEVSLTGEWTRLEAWRSGDQSGYEVKLATFFINYRSELIFRLDGRRDEQCELVEEPDSWLRLISAKLDYFVGPDGQKQTNAGSMLASSKLRTYGLGALWRAASESPYSSFVGMRKVIVEDEASGHQFKRVIWSVSEDGDDEDELTLKLSFLFNLTMWQMDNTLKRTRRSYELLSLESIYIDDLPGPNEDEQSKFSPFRARAISIKRRGSQGLAKEEQASFSLPDACRAALKKANLREELKRDFFSLTSLPSFKEYLGDSQVYSFRYELTQAIDASITAAIDGEKSAMNSVLLQESFDKQRQRGKLVVGQGRDTVEIYVDAKARAIYSYALASDLCKRVASVRPLLQPEVLPVPQVANQNFDLDKLYGLAALWTQLAGEAEGLRLRIRFEHDMEGNIYELRTYHGQLAKKAGERAQANVFLTFKSRPNLVRANSGIREEEELSKKISAADYQLVAVRVSPKAHRVWHSTEQLHSAQINVELASNGRANKWELPEACASLAPTATDASPGFEFPKISSMIRQSDQFYMRSEVSLSRPIDPTANGRRLYLLDEWLYKGALRMKSYGLKKNLDLLVYANTRESFDISTPFKCSSQLPPDLIQGGSSAGWSNLVEFWAEGGTLINMLGQLYYGPVSLWRLAEKNLDNVKLASEVELAPRPQQDAKEEKKPTKDQLAREFRSEVWRVSQPQSSNTKAPGWSYEMHFERFALTDARNVKIREWAVLQSIVIEEPELVGGGRLVEIDVINYDWNQRKGKYLEKFVLPEGYGCRRGAEVLKQLRQNNDDLALNVDLEFAISYEASLELVERTEADAELGSLTLRKQVLPAVTGTFFRSTSLSLGYGVNLFAHFARSRRSDGSMIALKRVYDARRSIVYEIDRLTGVCRIGYAKDRVWQLDFSVPKYDATSADNEVASMRLDSETFERLFLRTAAQDYQPINSYVTGSGLEVTTYEKYYDALRLTDKLAGPAFVVRTYKNLKGFKPKVQVDKDSIRTRLRDSISVKVILFSDAERWKVKAEFSMTLLTAKNVGVNAFVDALNVAQCYNDGQRHSDRATATFVLEYHTDREQANSVEPFRPKTLARQFMHRLMKRAKLLPTQLDGAPKVERSGARNEPPIVRVHLRLLEAPSAVEHFKMKPDSSLSDDLKMRAEFKLLPDVEACSDWCEAIECVAMSYCKEHTCYVLALRALEPPIADSTWKLDYFLQSNWQHQPDCVYLYKSELQPLKLAKFRDLMESVVNERQSEAARNEFALIINEQPTLPTKFYELNQNFETIDEDADEAEESPNEAYKILRHDFRLSAGKLNELVSEEGSSMSSRMESSYSFAQCADKSAKAGALLAAYCHQATSCAMLWGERLDLKRIQQEALEPTDFIQGCVVIVKDLTLKYARFENTLRPENYELMLQSHTTLECAARCESANEDDQTSFTCLSFDSCAFASDKNDESANLCFLQRMHVMLDEFDRTILEARRNVPANRSKLDDKELICDHYSRSLLADFKQIIDRELAQAEAVQRGSNAERCAAECQSDSLCSGFQFCLDYDQQPAQSCAFIRRQNTDLIAQSETKQAESPQLVVSKKCSVYMLRHALESFASSEHPAPESPVDLFVQQLSELTNGGTGGWILSGLCYLAAALVIGSLLQLTYIRFRGRPVIFD